MKRNLQLTAALFVTISPLLLADDPPVVPGDVPFSYNKSDPAADRLVQSDFSISKNGKLAVSGMEMALNGDATGWAVWDIKTAKRVCKGKGTSFTLHSIAISEDGNLVAVGGDQCLPAGQLFQDPDKPWPVELKIFNAASGELLKVLGGHAVSMNKLAFTRDGKHLVSLSSDDVLRVWTVPKGEAVVKVCFTSRDPDRNEWKGDVDSPKDKAASNVVHDKQIEEAMNFAISPDGKTIAVATATREVFILDTLTGKLLDTYTCKKIITSENVSYSPDGRLLVIGGSSKLVPVLRLDRPPQVGERTPDGWMEVWNVREKTLLTVLGEHDGSVLCHAISPDNSHLISGGSIDGARVWDIATGKMKYQLKEAFKKDEVKADSVGTVAFLPDGKTFAVLRYFSLVRFWDLATGKEIEPTKLLK